MSNNINNKKNWKESLSPLAYEITRNQATEKPFTGPYLNEKRDGVYSCICCDQELFSSRDKYDSKTGWPSFFNVIRSGQLNEKTDYLNGYARTEIVCSRCDAHIGHVFQDGPPPTNLRYCTNGNALNFTYEAEIPPTNT